MSQTLITQSASAADATGAHDLTWVSPSADLWVASSLDANGVRFLGFVEQSLEAFVAVDGAGTSRGRHRTLADAKRAVQGGSPAPASSIAPAWGSVGAPVLTVRELRVR